jgi:excinuclease ABC subunit C
MALTKPDETLAQQLKRLPAQPGCYLFADADGKVLYVGKALSLRSRVRSYFQRSTRHGARIARMVAKVRSVDWLVVDSELEALVLECNLIKKHRPPYNVRMRDDKSYPYITITNEAFPRVLFTRKVRKDGSRYFGPYTSSWSVRDTLKLLHKVFPLIPCGKSWSGEAVQRPCLYHHLGQCLAPCAGLSDREEYRQVIEQVQQFLEGKADELTKELEAKMNAAAEDLDFESAAAYRDRLAALQGVLQQQKVLSSDLEDRDVISVVRDDRGAAIQMLYIRHGRLIGHRQFLLDGSADSSPTEAVQEFVKQYYSDAHEVPREILLPVEIEEREIVQRWLRQRRGRAVSVEVPKRGDKLRLVDMAATNAEQTLAAMRHQDQEREQWAERALDELQLALDLPAPPLRIEGYDISNIQGVAPVGSMVVVENGQPAKAEYRRFKVKYQPESPNDFAMMREVIGRRLRAYLAGEAKFSRLPDLIVVDGGRGQLSAALRARDELGLTVPMVGLAKRMEILIRPSAKNGAEGGAYEDIELPLTSPGLLLIRRLRDEAHRFALTFHRKVRSKRMVGSALEDIPGVGPRRKRMLLRTFGSVEGVRRATVEEIAAVPTLTRRMAEAIKESLSED